MLTDWDRRTTSRVLTWAPAWSLAVVALTTRDAPAARVLGTVLWVGGVGAQYAVGLRWLARRSAT